MFTISTRGAIAAVDGAPVPEAAILLPRLSSVLLVQCSSVSTGAPASYALRAALEASMDGGLTWQQVVRFQDFVADGAQLVRAAAQTTVGDATIAASNLGAAAGAPVVVETPWPRLVRCVTKLQSLTGGVAPTITPTIVLELGD